MLFLLDNWRGETWVLHCQTLGAKEFALQIHLHLAVCKFELRYFAITSNPSLSVRNLPPPGKVLNIWEEGLIYCIYNYVGLAFETEDEGRQIKADHSEIWNQNTYVYSPIPGLRKLLALLPPFAVTKNDLSSQANLSQLSSFLSSLLRSLLSAVSIISKRWAGRIPLHDWQNALQYFSTTATFWYQIKRSSSKYVPAKNWDRCNRLSPPPTHIHTRTLQALCI